MFQIIRNLYSIEGGKYFDRDIIYIFWKNTNLKFHHIQKKDTSPQHSCTTAIIKKLNSSHIASRSPINRSQHFQTLSPRVLAGQHEPVHQPLEGAVSLGGQLRSAEGALAQPRGAADADDVRAERAGLYLAALQRLQTHAALGQVQQGATVATGAVGRRLARVRRWVERWAFHCGCDERFFFSDLAIGDT